MSTFEHKVAVITGGASGIGAALGAELARRGATVVLADVDLAGAERVAAAIRARQGRAEGLALDVRDAAAVAAAVAGARSRHGRLDFMFNNAGAGLAAELRDTGLDDWTRVLDINLRGVIHGVHAAYPLMVEQGHGHIVNTASITGLTPLPLSGAYNTSKFAVVGLSLTLREEAAGLGVRVTCVCPGFIDTAMKDTITTIGMDRQAGRDALPFRLHPADACARAIVRGVARNRALVVVTPAAQALWVLYRISPALFTRLGAFAARQSRRLRAAGRL